MSTVLFARGIIARLQMWSVMRAAIQEGWGGDPTTSKSKATWLASSIVDAFEEAATAATNQQLPDDEYIEMMLLQVMADEFGTVLEDGSAEAVAVDICKLWDETKDGQEILMNKFETAAAKFSGKKMEIEQGIVEEGKEEEEWLSTDDEDESDDDAPRLMDSEPAKPKSEPVVDDDGFTLVEKKGKR